MTMLIVLIPEPNYCLFIVLTIISYRKCFETMEAASPCILEPLDPLNISFSEGKCVRSLDTQDKCSAEKRESFLNFEGVNVVRDPSELFGMDEHRPAREALRNSPKDRKRSYRDGTRHTQAMKR